jgi:hypothetical protein
MNPTILIALCVAFPAVVAGIKFWRSIVPAPNRLWVNESGLTDAQLRAIWASAQTRIATLPIYMNAVRLPGVDKVFLPADQRAFTVMPRNVKVIAEDKLSVPNANGYSRYGNTNWPEVHMLSKYVYPTDTAANDGAIGWEFENLIIWRLGYSMKGR